MQVVPAVQAGAMSARRTTRQDIVLTGSASVVDAAALSYVSELLELFENGRSKRRQLTPLADSLRISNLCGHKSENNLEGARGLHVLKGIERSRQSNTFNASPFCSLRSILLEVEQASEIARKYADHLSRRASFYH